MVDHLWKYAGNPPHSAGLQLSFPEGEYQDEAAVENEDVEAEDGRSR